LEQIGNTLRGSYYDPQIGILGYGVYLPIERISTAEVVKDREGKKADQQYLDKIRYGLRLRNKSIAGPTEDSISIGTEAAENAIKMAGIDPKELGYVGVGSESKVYAVGQTARHIATFVGSGHHVSTLDAEAACNPGMQQMDLADSQIRAGKARYALVVGTDVSQAPRGDPLEYAAGAGAAAYVLGRDDPLAVMPNRPAHYSSLLLDFWRRDGQPVPKHFGKTTVKAYQDHVLGAIAKYLAENPDVRLSEIDHITYHQPSGYMPKKVGEALTKSPIKIFYDPELEKQINTTNIGDRMKLTEDEVKTKFKLWGEEWGNTYAASTLMNIAGILDTAVPDDDVLAVSYGSGAYSTATHFKVKDAIEGKRGRTPTVEDYVNRKREIDIPTFNSRIARQDHEKLSQLPRLVAEINNLEPLTKDEVSLSVCKDNGNVCRIYAPARSECLDPNCTGQLQTITLPKEATVKDWRKVSRRERLHAMASSGKHKNLLGEIYLGHEIPLVDYSERELRAGLPHRAVIRRLYDEGADGYRIYGWTMRPESERFPITEIKSF